MLYEVITYVYYSKGTGKTYGFGIHSLAQVQKLDERQALIDRGLQIDTTRIDRTKKSKGVKNTKAKIEDYKIISFERDTTFLDTTLTLKKEYKFNYLRKDNFNLIQFSNIGQTYNTLSENFQSTRTRNNFV